ncbi:CLUMA_CG011984, isoform A [Clunio marinus]|uniref:CLUMA_CG011984, isoform A n=1 Tax=Clunio marinus TaxID=568069 RepID=A0A1J1IH51_9DIPT|nr:CLUMA_CG011984, isoform A [Clunio marinus]
MSTRSGEKRRSAAVKQEHEESKSKTEARSKLNKALEKVETEQEKEKEQQESSEESETEVRRKKSVKAEKEDSPVIKEQKLVKPIKPVAQPSYIMKLFDRSVNLARFSEDSPLYPLCRAWMENQPRSALPIKHEFSPDTLNIQTVEEGDVVEMPKIRIRKSTKPVIPRKESKVDIKDLDKAIDSEIWTKEKLLDFHRSRWAEERAKHIETMKNFEEKHFAANLELLETLIKIEE